MEDAKRALDENASVEDVFLREAQYRIAEAARILEGPFPQPGTQDLRTLHRHAHSLKGAAGQLNHPRLEALAREIVEHIAPFEREAGEVPASERELVTRDFRALADEVNGLTGREG